MFLSLLTRPPPSTLFPYTTLFRSVGLKRIHVECGIRNSEFSNAECGIRNAESGDWEISSILVANLPARQLGVLRMPKSYESDRKSTRLNSSHANISYAVFCLKKKS